MRAASKVAQTLRETSLDARVRYRIALHRGQVLAATLSHHLDYFGETVALALRLPDRLSLDSVGFTDAIRNDTDVTAYLASITKDAVVTSTTESFGTLHRLQIGG